MFTFRDYSDSKREPHESEGHNPKDSHEAHTKAVRKFVQTYNQRSKGEIDNEDK